MERIKEYKFQAHLQLLALLLPLAFIARLHKLLAGEFQVKDLI